MQALDGIRVLDLTHVFAGPFCAYQLGVMGAEVIKIEPVHQPDMTRDVGARRDLSEQGLGLGYIAQASGKKAIAVDLASEEGQRIFQQLVISADVIVQNYATSCLEKIGLLPTQLQAINPRVICCSISGYGRTGPKANHPAYDVVIQAFTGVMASNGEADSPPVRIGPPVIDYGTGAQAALAVCAALFARERGGPAAVIDVSMADCALMLMTANVTTTQSTGTAPRPFGNQDPGLATYSAYPTADGTIMLGAYTPKQAANLMLALGNSKAAVEIGKCGQNDLSKRRAKDAEYLSKTLISQPAHYWEDLLNSAHVPAARVRTLEEALAEPQFASRHVLQPISIENEQIKLPVTGFHMAPGQPEPAAAPPKYGQDARTILRGLGYSDEDISRLYQSQVIK
jgi:crotonobetainyl-CoA:carnitine CoA-transferase CaiB-like acyl-CoA transferase